MSKFNANVTTKTVNKCGVPAFRMDVKDKLVSQVLTTFFNEPKFYGDNSEEIIENIKAVLEIDPGFVANLAMYARKEMHLRSISHVLVAELANHNNGKPFAREAIAEVVERVDDITEILSYHLATYGKPIPASMKKGIADAFSKFDEYQLAKYNRKKEIKLKDVLNLVHPKPLNSAQSNMWKRLLDGSLATPVTWETELSAKGNTKEVWESLIAENKLGYMAMLRNLRNIIQADVSNIGKVYEFLSDEKNVLRNKQLPFRYYSAYNALKGLGTSKLFDALEKAIKISTRNISRLEGKTLIAADVSGSMTYSISNRSTVTSAEIATLLLSIANYICDETITVTFDTDLYMCSLPTTNGIISNANSIDINGGGTDITLPFRYLINNKIYVDRIIILSDNEINSNWDQERSGWGRSVPCQSVAEKYRREVNPDVWIHAIDLQGYGTQQFKGKNTNIIAGWSERTLEFIALAEQGVDTLRRRIEEYKGR